MTQVLQITMTYDPEADAWWATSDDVPGLVTEAATMEGLVARASEIAPELLTLNRPGWGEACLEFRVTRQLQEA